MYNLSSGHPYKYPCYGKLSAMKKVSTDQRHLTVSRAQLYNFVEVTCLLKLSGGQLLVLIDRRLRSIMKRPINLVRSVIIGKCQSSRPQFEISL